MYNLISLLPPSIVSKATDILESILPEHEPYSHLKEPRLERTGFSDKGIFSNSIMGKKTPSQFLQLLKSC